MLEFEISWKNKPDFVLALGVGDDEKSIQRAFRFEVWERDLIVQRETEQEADVASVGEISQGAGRMHLIAYLDQEKGRILVFTADGKPLADLKVAAGQPQVLGGLSLTNKRGDVRLERLRIARWNGEPPQQVERGRSRIHRVDGSIVYGQVSRFDAAAKAFVITEAKGESRIPEDQIAGVYLSLPGEAKGRSLAAVYQDGSRLSGELNRVENSSLHMSVPGIKETLSLSSRRPPSLGLDWARGDSTGHRRGSGGPRAGRGSLARPPGRWPGTGDGEQPGLAATGEQHGQSASPWCLGTDRLP